MIFITSIFIALSVILIIGLIGGIVLHKQNEMLE